jgi:hypothetical protein
VYHHPLLPASKIFTRGVPGKYTITTQIPADLVTITGQPSWVTVAAGTQPNQIIISATAPVSTLPGPYPTTVTVQGLALPATTPNFTINVS